MLRENEKNYKNNHPRPRQQFHPLLFHLPALRSVAASSCRDLSDVHFRGGELNKTKIGKSLEEACTQNTYTH